ncbi:hypothetical protein NOR_07491 [Metarhizium rileyi]|uniref:Uncharacterized protein n=1 Tax=Metarhizium rileyi (strain RCEF 4871) TaxID=1649241 RepID=A0A166Y149_METRR|nr:hypothetical protein NOR_07491 [Metarhizium rileyi RCEF 4871]
MSAVAPNAPSLGAHHIVYGEVIWTETRQSMVPCGDAWRKTGDPDDDLVSWLSIRLLNARLLVRVLGLAEEADCAYDNLHQATKWLIRATYRHERRKTKMALFE